MFSSCTPRGGATASGPRRLLSLADQFHLQAGLLEDLAYCGADHSAFIRDIREREGRLREEVTHPWLHNTQNRAEQHLRDEAAYPEDSPWRYNNITSDNTNDE